MRRLLVIAALLLALGLVSSIALAWAGATMWRGYDIRSPLTGTWFHKPRFEVGQTNQWRVAEWNDATLTRRWGWGWRDEWFVDPLEAHLRRVTLGSDAEDRRWDEIDVPSFSRAQRPPPEEPAPIALYVHALPSFLEREAGWPMRCLRVRWVAGDDRLDTPGERIRGGVLASFWIYPWGSHAFHPSMQHWNTEDEHAIPLTPMWVGLAINTVVWALLWALAVALLLSVPLIRRVRWLLRSRRGCCIRCAYEIGADLDQIVYCPECGHDLRTRWRWPWRRLLWSWSVALAALLVLLAWFVVVRVSTADRLPPMHQAAADGDAQRVRELLAAGALADDDAPDLRPLNISPMQGARPIEWAAARGHTRVVDELIAAGAYYDMIGDQRSPLALAVACGHDDIVQRLLAAGASVTKAPKTTPAPIAIAAWQGDEALLEAMFDQMDAMGRESATLQIFQVVLAGRDESIRRMVLDRTDSTFRDERAVAIAAFRHGDQDLLEAMFARGFDPRSSPADFVGMLGHVPDPSASIEVLVAEGVDLRQTDSVGNTALHYVCYNGEAPGAIRRLVELGVPLDARNGASMTALHMAAGKGDAANVRALLELGADANVLDVDGNTPRDLWWRGRRGTDEYDRIRDLLEAAEGSP